MGIAGAGRDGQSWEKGVRMFGFRRRTAICQKLVKWRELCGILLTLRGRCAMLYPNSHRGWAAECSCFEEEFHEGVGGQDPQGRRCAAR